MPAWVTWMNCGSSTVGRWSRCTSKMRLRLDDRCLLEQGTPYSLDAAPLGRRPLSGHAALDYCGCPARATSIVDSVIMPMLSVRTGIASEHRRSASSPWRRRRGSRRARFVAGQSIFAWGARPETETRILHARADAQPSSASAGTAVSVFRWLSGRVTISA